MRLIDGDALLDAMPKNDVLFSADVRRIITDTPTIDAVPTEFHDKCMELEIKRRFDVERALTGGLMGGAMQGIEQMGFGEAIDRARHGKRIRREGWNGKTQYVELAKSISYVNAKGEVVNCDHEAIGNAAFAFVGTSGVQIGWLASQADMLAEDWVEVADD